MHETLLAQVDARSKLLLTLFGAICTIIFSSLGAQFSLFVFSFAVALLIKRPTLLVVLYALMTAMMGLAIACTFVLISFIPALGGLTVEKNGSAFGASQRQCSALPSPVRVARSTETKSAATAR